MKSLMDEWGVVERLLPRGWQEAAREQGAFRRARYIKDPSTLLRVLLFHAVNGAGLRQSVALLSAAGVAQLSQVALHKRLKGAVDWLTWLAAGLCEKLRERPRREHAMRLRVVDGTTIQGPASRGTQWRLHYTLDLSNLQCDWLELTGADGGEHLERVPVAKDDLLLADRNFLTASGMAHLADAGAYAVIRLRWNHPRLLDAKGQDCQALNLAKGLKVGKTGDWPVYLRLPAGRRIAARVVALRLPAPLAKRARERARRIAAKKRRQIRPSTLKAAGYVLLLTTLPKEKLSAADVLELYRYRWQIELAFKWLKQLLQIGRLPHQDPQAARGWIQAKLVVALLLETLFRSARIFSPWGYPLQGQKAQSARG